MVDRDARVGWRRACAGVVLLLLLGAQAPANDDAAIAASLAQMLRSARTVISANQVLINDPEKGDKGLTGKVVLAQSIKNYQRLHQVPTRPPSTQIHGKAGCCERRWMPLSRWLMRTKQRSMPRAWASRPLSRPCLRGW